MKIIDSGNTEGVSGTIAWEQAIRGTPRTDRQIRVIRLSTLRRCGPQTVR